MGIDKNLYGRRNITISIVRYIVRELFNLPFENPLSVKLRNYLHLQNLDNYAYYYKKLEHALIPGSYSQ